MVELGACDKALAAVGAGQLGLGVVVLQVVVQAVLLRGRSTLFFFKTNFTAQGTNLVVQAVLLRVGQCYFSSKQTSKLRA